MSADLDPAVTALTAAAHARAAGRWHDVEAAALRCLAAAPADPTGVLQAQALSFLAEEALERAQVGQALELARRAVTSVATLPMPHSAAAWARQTLANALHQDAQTAAAAAVITEALEIRRHLYAVPAAAGQDAAAEPGQRDPSWQPPPVVSALQFPAGDMLVECAIECATFLVDDGQEAAAEQVLATTRRTVRLRSVDHELAALLLYQEAQMQMPRRPRTALRTLGHALTRARQGGAGSLVALCGQDLARMQWDADQQQALTTLRGMLELDILSAADRCGVHITHADLLLDIPDFAAAWAALDQAQHGVGDADPQLAGRLAEVWARYWTTHGDPLLAVVWCTRACAVYAGSPAQLLAARMALAEAQQAAGDLHGAAATLQALLADSSGTDDPDDLQAARCLLTQVLADDGRPAAAEQVALQGLHDAIWHHGSKHRWVQIWLAHLQRLYHGHGIPRQALTRLRRLLRAAPPGCLLELPPSFPP